MSKKTCEAFFCNNKCNPKYRYCYQCAKKKGLIGSGGGSGSLFWIVVILFLIWIM